MSNRTVTVLALATAMLCLAHALAQGIGALVFWQPCFAEGFGNVAYYDAEPCTFLQYDAPAPWWMHLAWLWWLEVALTITVLVLALRRPGHPARRGAAIAALALVILSNPVTDYVAAMGLSGGYVSADAAPTFGITGAILLLLAAACLALVPAPRRPTPSPPSRCQMKEK